MAELVEAAEVVEEVVGKAFSSRDFGLGATVGLVVGGAVAYYFANKYLAEKYNDITTEEIESMREHYRSKEVAREQKPKLEKIVEEQGYVAAPIPGKEEVAGSSLTKARDIARENEQDPDVIAEADAAVERSNVFEKAKVEDEWDYEEEVRMRRPDYPYVIHVDEQGELAELDQLTWTYYEGDEILCNAGDEVVTDVERSVGLSNLDKFGHGSGDANVVYIRNVVLGLEIEILRSTGKYEEEVLGLQHADESIRRRKRSFDDDSG